MNWTREQLKLAFSLYCQLPFGRLHKGNPEIIELATLIDRTPSAVAMKLVNFASLDPAIIESGRHGLGNASNLDREIWAEFHGGWESLALQSAQQLEHLRVQHNIIQSPASILNEDVADYAGETRQAVIAQRIKQDFFRRTVLSSYHGRCCMTGVTEQRLLVASHIVPWSADRENRLNPRNGLCLSAIHDKAFDRGLLTLSDDYRVMLSKSLLNSGDAFIQKTFLPLQDQAIELPERFMPDRVFLAQHRATQFLDHE
jgi:hypothetical protein